MRELPFENVAEDFHVPVRMCPKPPARSDTILVYDAQGAKSHVLRVKVIGEGKSMARIEPPVVCMAPFFTSAQCNHDSSFLPTHLTSHVLDTVGAPISYIVMIEG
jgi:hypothetical protein